MSIASTIKQRPLQSRIQIYIGTYRLLRIHKKNLSFVQHCKCCPGFFKFLNATSQLDLTLLLHVFILMCRCLRDIQLILCIPKVGHLVITYFVVCTNKNDTKKEISNVFHMCKYFVPYPVLSCNSP